MEKWPNNADGDVFRRLKKHGFDFNRTTSVNFIIDFDHWPLHTNEREYILNLYPNAIFFEPDEADILEGEEIGDVEITIQSILSYQFVIETQKLLTNQMKVIGGWCDAWGSYS